MLLFYHTCCLYSDFSDDFEEQGLLPLMCFLREKGQLPTWREALVYKRVCVGTKEMKPAVSSMWASTAPEHEVTVSENLKA